MRTISLRLAQYNESDDTYLVLCKPITGRTHQIRLHCQFLGYPIANDPNYGGELFFNDPEAAANAARSKLKNGTELDHTPAKPSEISTGNFQLEGEKFTDFLCRVCVWCRRGATEKSPEQFAEYSQGIWLHAFCYQFSLGETENKMTSIQSEYPSWGSETGGESMLHR